MTLDIEGTPRGDRDPPGQQLKTLSMTDRASVASPSEAKTPRIRLGFSVVNTVSPTARKGFMRSPTPNKLGSQLEKPRTRVASTPGSPVRKPVCPERISNNNNDEGKDDSDIDDSAYEDDDSADELSANFRLLASKEMAILETKNSIKELNKRQRLLDREIRDLKVRIERQLVINARKEAGSSARRWRLEQQKQQQQTEQQQQQQHQQQQVANRKILRDSGTVRTRPSTPSGKPIMALDKQSRPPLLARNNGQPANHSETSPSPSPSWLSRPMNILQHVDSLISQEFDKLEILDEKERLREEAYSDLDKRRREINQPIKRLADGPDVMQSVSQHLWSFVNEVKSNLLLEDPADEVMDLKKNHNTEQQLLELDTEIDDSDLWDTEPDLLEL